MARTLQIAIAFALSEPHQVRVLRGMHAFAEKQGNWAFTFSPEQFGGSIAALRRWSGDGVLATITTPREAQVAREIGIPVLNLSGVLRDAGLPRVMVDQEAMGHLAAEHLRQCGFGHFGYFGPRRVWSGVQRKQGFVRRVGELGGTCAVLETPSSPGTHRPAREWLESLDRWLGALPLPVGILASIDLRGAMIIDSCARLGLRVPDDVGVLGIDNNEVICELCRVPLSSVSRSDFEVGYRAAALLHRMIAGKSHRTGDVLIPPDGIVQRRSTNIVAVDHPEIAAAVRYLQEHVGEPFGIERLVQVVGRSRRWLTEHFRASLGCTPYDYICRVRVEEAKRLLEADAGLRFHEIAQRCGFSETRDLRHVFERLTGTSPARHRRSLRRPAR